MNSIIDLKFTKRTPDKGLTDFVNSFWILENSHDVDKVVTILPDGYFDILFHAVNKHPFECMLFGLATKSVDFTMPAHSVTYAISLKLPAVEHILMRPIAGVLDKFDYEPSESKWFECLSTASMDEFVRSASRFLLNRLEQNAPAKNLDVFRQIYESNGSIRVDELSEKNKWKSRQVNRYFHTYFGMSLKAYCGILRFRASFDQLNKGVVPDQQYYDQPHFIREVSKFSGTTPKELAKNSGDRFVQLSTLKHS